MDELKVSQKEFEEIVSEFGGKETYRGDMWYRCRKLLETGFIYEAYSLLLATWNFARFRYFMKDMQPNQFNSLILKSERIFKRLDHISFTTANFYEKELKANIIDLFNVFRNINGIEQTGTSKLLALRKPDLFVMWDRKIREKYKIKDKGTADDYLLFLDKMQKQFNHLNWDSKKKPFAKAIDEFNYYIAHSDIK